MKQIYNFEKMDPPRICEEELLRELKRRSLQRQALCLAVGSLLIACCMLLTAFCLSDTIPLFSAVCAGYLCAAGAGGGAMAFVFVRRKEEEIPC